MAALGIKAAGEPAVLVCGNGILRLVAVFVRFIAAKRRQKYPAVLKFTQADKGVLYDVVFDIQLRLI